MLNKKAILTILSVLILNLAATGCRTPQTRIDITDPHTDEMRVSISCTL
jgi:hypothetical protein